MSNPTFSPLPFLQKGKILIEPSKFTNNYDGFYLLLSKLVPLDQHSSIIVLESTTHYDDILVCFLINKDFKVYAPNSLLTSFIGENSMRKAKTNEFDTYVIAKTLMVQDSLSSLP